MNASAKVTPASAGKAIGNFAMKVAFPLQVGIAAYELFTELGVTPTRSSDGTLTMTKPQPNMGYCNGDNSTSQCIAGWSPVWPTPASVCSKMESDYNNAYGYMGYTFVVTYYAAGSSPNAGPYGWCDRQAWINGVKSNFGRGQPYVAGVQNGTTNAPYSITDLENEIASKSGWPTNSPVARALRDAINAGEPVQLEAPTVSGPATVNGPKETTNNPDGSRQEKQTVYNFNYAGDTINYTTTVVTTTYNSSNVQTGQTTTTTENEQPKPEDHCKTNPDTVGCTKLGEPPTGDIPKTTKTVSFTAENLSLGGGSCPPPYTWTDSAGSHAISLQPWCDFASSIIKPLLLAFAALSAYFIVAGAVVKD